MPKDFSRDLGYLDKFLQGLRAHAATLGDPAGSRLATLMDEQDRAWAEIRGILTGETAALKPVSGKPVSGKPAAASEAAHPPASAAVSAPAGESPVKRLTVGSLIS